MNPIGMHRRFRSRKLNPKELAKVDLNNTKAREFAEVVNGQCPDNREKALAIAKIEEALMWANKSIMMGEEVDDETGY